MKDLHEVVDWTEFQYTLEEQLKIDSRDLEKLLPLIGKNKNNKLTYKLFNYHNRRKENSERSGNNGCEHGKILSIRSMVWAILY